jgi:hypothetical protein
MERNCRNSYWYRISLEVNITGKENRVVVTGDMGLTLETSLRL